MFECHLYLLPSMTDKLDNTLHTLALPLRSTIKCLLYIRHQSNIKMIECLLSLSQRPHVNTNDNFGSAAKIRQNLSDDNLVRAYLYMFKF